MNYFRFMVLPCILAGIVSYHVEKSGMEVQQQEKERVIKEYFSGWEKKDWNAISSLLADEFTFTSPNDDDHISTAQFYDKCWAQAEYIQKFRFIKIIGNENEAFVMYECSTRSSRTFRNTEYFCFHKGKIKSIEVFFGAGQGYPSNEK